MTDSKSAKLYKKEHEANGFAASRKPQQSHHNAYAICGNWGIFRSSSCGRFYYHNSSTGASQWEKPREWNIKPDIDELIATHGNGNASHRDPSSSVSSQKSSASSFSQQQLSHRPSSSKRTQQSGQPINRNGNSPFSLSNSTEHRRDSFLNSKHHHSSTNNDYNSMDAPPKRRKQDVTSPSGTPQSSGSGGSVNVSSSQNKSISNLSEALIQQVRDRLDNIQGAAGVSSASQSTVNKQQNSVGQSLSPSHSSTEQHHSRRQSANNTRPASPTSASICAKPLEVESSDTSTKGSTDSLQQRLQAEEPFGSLIQRCDRAISGLDLSSIPPRPQICELLVSASDEMALRLEKQARRLRDETVSKYDIAAQTSVQVKSQRSFVRKIDIISEINAKRIANIQKQIEELVASRKDLAAMLIQQPRLAPFMMPPLNASAVPTSNSATSALLHR